MWRNSVRGGRNFFCALRAQIKTRFARKNKLCNEVTCKVLFRVSIWEAMVRLEKKNIEQMSCFDIKQQRGKPI